MSGRTPAQTEREKLRYATDPEYRERKLARNREWQRANPEKIKASNATRTGKRKRNPDTERAYHLWTKYGITVEDYETLLEQQGGRCAVCGTYDPGKRFFSVDHDHATGRVRGLLCQPCNLGLGHLKDDLEIVTALAAYLLGSQPSTEE